MGGNGNETKSTQYEIPFGCAVKRLAYIMQEKVQAMESIDFASLTAIHVSARGNDYLQRSSRRRGVTMHREEKAASEGKRDRRGRIEAGGTGAGTEWKRS